MNTTHLINQYLAAPAVLRQAIEGLSPQELDSFPIPGTWSIRQVVCHLADAEILYADRMKRILAEDSPLLMKVEPERFLRALGVGQRDLADELKLIEAVRTHLGQILAGVTPEQFERLGIHSTDGPLTLHAVLERAVAHIPHHLAFILAKREAMRGLK